MNTTKSINSTFGFEPAIPGLTMSNKLIDLKYTGKIKKKKFGYVAVWNMRLHRFGNVLFNEFLRTLVLNYY